MEPQIVMPLIFLGIFCFGWLVTTYNKFIKYKNRIEEAWSSIDITLKQRVNLIPNLVAVVKGYSEHESEIFESKYERFKGEKNIDDRMADESTLTSSLTNLLALAEAYPDLKASVNFLELQKNLADIEEDIQQARMHYNKAVARFNTQVESFPASLMAAKFGFEKQHYFSLDLVTQRELPGVELGKDT